MKNSKRFRRSQDNQKHCQPHVSKYAAKQAAKYDRDEEAAVRHPSRGTVADSQDAREFYANPF